MCFFFFVPFFKIFLLFFVLFCIWFRFFFVFSFFLFFRNFFLYLFVFFRIFFHIFLYLFAFIRNYSYFFCCGFHFFGLLNMQAVLQDFANTHNATPHPPTRAHAKPDGKQVLEVSLMRALAAVPPTFTIHPSQVDGDEGKEDVVPTWRQSQLNFDRQKKLLRMSTDELKNEKVLETRRSKRGLLKKVPKLR